MPNWVRWACQNAPFILGNFTDSNLWAGYQCGWFLPLHFLLWKLIGSFPQIQMNPPLKLTYSEKLNKLEKQYEILLVSDQSLSYSCFFNLFSIVSSLWILVPFRAIPESSRATWKACTTLCHRRLRNSSGWMKRRKRRLPSTGAIATVASPKKENTIL